MTMTRVATRPSRDVTVPPWVLWMIVALFLAPALVMTRADPDLWGHLRFGLDTLEHRALSSVDPYSFTQDIPWVNHEWLSELCMALAYRLGGTAALSGLKGVLVATFLGIVLAAYSHAAPAAAGAVIILLEAGTGRQTMTLRP